MKKLVSKFCISDTNTYINLRYWLLHFKRSTSIIIHKPKKLVYNSLKTFCPIFLLNILGKLIKKVISKSVICKSTCSEIMSLQWNHLQIIQACLPWQPPFLQHVLWQCCNHLGILSSTVEILLFNLVFHDRVTPVSVSTLKPSLGAIGVLPLKPWVSPILSVCI